MWQQGCTAAAGGHCIGTAVRCGPEQGQPSLQAFHQLCSIARIHVLPELLHHSRVLRAADAVLCKCCSLQLLRGLRRICMLLGQDMELWPQYCLQEGLDLQVRCSPATASNKGQRYLHARNR